MKYIPYKDRKAFAADLKTVYAAVNEETAMNNLIDMKEQWSGKYPNAIKSWEDNWDTISTFFAFPDYIRKIIYTTNAIESLNSQFRKVTKTKSSPKVKLTLKRIKKATGYQVYILKKKNGKKAVVKRFTKKVSFTIKSKKLRNKKKLFVKVRGYVLVGGKKKYGKWSSVKKIKIKNK